MGYIIIDTSAKALRAFFRYAEKKGWSALSISNAIQGPRIFAQETLPAGPSWEEVRALISSMQTNSPNDVRDRAIIMLFAIYGMRSGEVADLRLEDLHWEEKQITIMRRKRRQPQTYPLISSVGNAIIQYLQEIRPQCSLREVFLTLKAPIKPLSTSGLHHATSKRLRKLGICTAHRGPHSLRHACAARLVSQGFSLKEIGDHLGHRSATSTRIYAKVNIPQLREVAEFNFGDAL